MKRAALALLTMVAVLPTAGCVDRDSSPAETPVQAAVQDSDRVTAFRVRADFDAPLNGDGGWAADVNRSATVEADRPFRLRFEVTAGGVEPATRSYAVQVRRNRGEWRDLPAEDFPYPLKVHRLATGEAGVSRVEGAWQIERGAASRIAWTGSDAGHWRFDAGGQALLALGRYDVHWRPSEFTAELRLAGDDGGASAGLVFDYRDGANLSRVDVAATGAVRLVKVERGEASILAEHRAEFDPARWTELAIVIEDDLVTVELGDEALVFSEPLPTDDLSPRLGVFVPENGAAAFRSLVIETEARTPRTSILRASSFEHGAPTRDLLAVSRQPFTGGAGISFAERTPPWRADGGHGEWSFPIVIRRFADGAVLNEDGDRFDYRLVGTDGEPLAADAAASVSLSVPDRHLGGTFVETPMRVGPWQAGNGDLYFIMEPAETWNRLMVVRSSDGGRTWREVDGANRPATGDLEGLGSVFVDGRIHILHQVSDEVLYHAFDTVDRDGNPDRWTIRDEHVAAPPQPPTQVADLAVRADGSVVAVYGSADSLRSRVRSADGGWGEERRIDGPDGAVPSGPTVVLGRDDVVHLAYTASDGTAWYRRVGADGGVGEAFRFASDLGTDDADVGAILPLVHLAGTDSVGTVYRNRDGRLFERRVGAGGDWSEPVVVSDRIVVQNAVDSDQVGADAVAVGEVIHVLFVEAGTGQLFHASGRDGEWRRARPVVTEADVQWVRGTVVEGPGGETVYGFVYDAGSDGGSGMNRFGQLPLR